MSSKRAASKIIPELFDLLAKVAQGGELVFKVHSKLGIEAIPRTTYLRKLKKFEQHGLVKKQSNDSGHVFVITPKAKFLRRKAISKVPRFDGNSTLIIFDIPEEKHNARDTLRRYLIRSGYTQIRESYFLSLFKISEGLKDLIKELKLRENVSIFSAKADYPF